jgi:hypothetical protein
MKTEKEIRQRLLEIESDERLSYEPALVEVNAPLALTQCSLGSQRDILKWVLNDEE